MGETGYAVEADYNPSAKQKPKKKAGNFFTRWMLKSLKNAVAEEQKEKEAMNQIKVPRGLQSIHSASIDSDKGIRFQVYKAQGGFVVETSSYDRTRDRHFNSLHIINDDEKFGDKIEKIITMEALKA